MADLAESEEGQPVPAEVMRTNNDALRIVTESHADQPVVETIAGLIPLPPEWIALWLRAHLDEIEARFAS